MSASRRSGKVRALGKNLETRTTAGGYTSYRSVAYAGTVKVVGAWWLNREKAEADLAWLERLLARAELPRCICGQGFDGRRCEDCGAHACANCGKAARRAQALCPDCKASPVCLNCGDAIPRKGYPGRLCDDCVEEADYLAEVEMRAQLRRAR